LLKIFSLPIVIGITLGVVFPYQSMSLVWLSSVLLFFLFLFNTLAIGPAQLFALTPRQWRESIITLILMFLVQPIFFAALALVSLKDRDFALGVVVASCAPSALVNPFFSRLRGADSSLTLLNVVLSSVLCPLMIVLMLYLTGFNAVFIEVRTLAIYLFALTALPLLSSLVIAWWWPSVSRFVTPALPPLNSFLLATLMFILVGCSLHQVPLRLLLKGDLLPLLLIFGAAEFGLFFVARQGSLLFMNKSSGEALALSLSTRNFAVSASLLLFFYPKAALPSAVGLMIHAVFFQWLAYDSAPQKAPL
jgi:predicted Na+-dependent transporter